MLTAYLDESYRADLARYLVAAVLILDEEADRITGLLNDLLEPTQRRLHWRKAGRPARRRHMAFVAALNQPSIVVYAESVSHGRQESARIAVLTRLLELLGGSGVDRLVLEQGPAHIETLDRQTLITARHQATLRSGFSYRHLSPDNEPLLWLADLIAGTIQHGRTAWPNLSVTIVAMP